MSISCDSVTSSSPSAAAAAAAAGSKVSSLGRHQRGRGV